MTTESVFIQMMRAIATDPAARGLRDDAAVIELGGESLILTHDMMAEGVHWLQSADPADVAWKLVAVNLSDLAAKGARPLGVLLGFMLGDSDWDRRFAEGLGQVLRQYSVSLLGGDTVSNRGDKRAVGLTAIGAATFRPVPSRGGAQPGDLLCVTGMLGDALAGFELIEAGFDPPPALAAAYNRPVPRIDDGKALAPNVTAMMDVSDGLLIDAERIATASGVAIEIDLAKIPLSEDYRACRGENRDSRLQAASWGDDYQLLFTISADIALPVAATIIGRVGEGSGISVLDAGAALPLPPSLGYQHH
ncbi:MAG: thiamine-phosphate kinase [Sphingomonadales bacterium]